MKRCRSANSDKTPDTVFMWKFPSVRGRPLVGGAALIVGAVLGGAALLSEREASAPPSPGAPAAAVSQASEAARASPAETVSLLQSLYQRRAYDALVPYIVAERRDVMVDMLEAVEAVLSANSRLLRVAQAAYSEEMFEPYDLSAMADNLGPFSAHIRLISQRFKGDLAVVTFQAGDHVPLVHAEFAWAEGRWQYRPEAMPARMAAELRELARMLLELADATERGAPCAAYHQALELQVIPQMARVATAQDDQGGALAAGLADGG